MRGWSCLLPRSDGERLVGFVESTSYWAFVLFQSQTSRAGFGTAATSLLPLSEPNPTPRPNEPRVLVRYRMEPHRETPVPERRLATASHQEKVAVCVSMRSPNRCGARATLNGHGKTRGRKSRISLERWGGGPVLKQKQSTARSAGQGPVSMSRFCREVYLVRRMGFWRCVMCV